jgi:hypothetical protein
MQRNDVGEFRPARQSSVWISTLAIIVVILAVAFGWWRWSLWRKEAASVAAVSQSQAAALADASSPSAMAGPRNPMEILEAPDDPLPALSDGAAVDARVGSALNALFGHAAAISFLHPGGFVRRAVATVDNLPRKHAPARLWPVVATPGRFTVKGNDNRYAPFVRFAESIDIPRAVALYARFYPLFQQAYEELGYPGGYFNDRLVAVIDHLLKTPEPVRPPAVRLTEVRGAMALEHPWLHYEFADPALQSLSAGQKILLRMGPDNERRMKALLAELRRQVADGALAKK